MPGPGVFAKSRRTPGPGFFQAEAAGLCWITVKGGPAVPVVRAVTEARSSGRIEMDRIPAGRPTAAAAARFGRELAALHAAGAPSFGAAPPGAPAHGWIGDLPMAYGDFADFPSFWAQARLLPAARSAHASGGISGPDLVELVGFCQDLQTGRIAAGPPVLPARVHGDLWSGNVVWGADLAAGSGASRAWLVDPAAHGGHPDSDLAMLALFGCPHLAAIVASYAEAADRPVPRGSQLALHQLWPLLVHAALFGPGYRAQAMAAMRAARGAD